jgi:hypothetical protein
MIPRPSPAGYDVAAVLTGREAAPAMRWIHAKKGRTDGWRNSKRAATQRPS